MISDININSETQKFIREHITCDVRELALKGSKEANVDFTFAIEQIMREDPLKNILNAGLRIEKKQ